MNIGIISCSGGGVFRELHKLLAPRNVNFAVVTDRACETETYCEENGIVYKRISSADMADFDKQAGTFLKQTVDPDFVLLFFHKIIGREIFTKFQTFNLHPSLLPAFPGFYAIRRAREAGARYLGATLHLATDEVDGGPIVAQSVWPLSGNEDDTLLNRISFVQKVGLALLLVSLYEQKSMVVDVHAGEISFAKSLTVGSFMNPELTVPEYLDHTRKLAKQLDLRFPA